MSDLHPNLVVLQNKSLLNLFTRVRDQTTSPSDFEFYAKRLMTILAEETIADLPLATSPTTVSTPCSSFTGSFVDSTKICAVSIVRAGDSLLGCVRSLLPGVSVGKILIQRDESVPSKPAKLFYSKLPPNIESKQVILCDPMLATGGSACKAIESLVAVGVPPGSIVFSNVVCCPEGLKFLAEKYPEVKIVTASIDEGLNEEKYIVPGLGDYGDRFFNTV
ncbi:hypothetical protein TrVE_jg5811 [Triparma verrucosa]|uniref:uracil phosphoribosyltransferase n=1 Tax=Triparma verrucosa TaxID=1606542 RepID=A0A9W7FBT3_9STRA|nr:hypothetical protein TrVE_jg5811 [Triparma verrucosa]